MFKMSKCSLFSFIIWYSYNQWRN